MKLTDVDTNNKRDMEILRIIAEYVPEEQLNVPAKKKTTQPEKVELARSETSKHEEIVIDSKQAESIFGLSATNITNNYRRNSEYGFDRIMSPTEFENSHPPHRRRWVLGTELIENMKPEDLDALKNGKSLKVPMLLSTQLINKALMKAMGSKAPTYAPTKKNQVRDAKIFSLLRPEKTTNFYLTLTDAWEKTNPEYHFAIQYYFERKGRQSENT